MGTEPLDSQKILVTGGLGYIGSHVAKRLASLGHHVGIFDNISSGCAGRLASIRASSSGNVEFVMGDIRNQMDLTAAFDWFRPEAVIHLAGQKVIERSFENPELFHSTNVAGTSSVLQAASSFGCHRVIFSSSASVYGKQLVPPVRENAALFPLSPYGETKILGEQCVRDWVASNSFERSAAMLRYFNPCGCEASLIKGEANSNADLSLSEKLVLVALNRQRFLEVLGTDHPTSDGSPVRDFIHRNDVVEAHVAALKAIQRQSFCEAVNVGTGEGTSVLQFVRKFEDISGIKIQLRRLPRAPADLSASKADTAKSRRVMSWRAQYGLDEICRNLWNAVSVKIQKQKTDLEVGTLDYKGSSAQDSLELVRYRNG
ncbi:MAG: UDP-glucose 4-epimerase GalE [Pseudomonadota bacterium]